MKNILTIFKKEWDRVIKDKRLVITVMILPGLMLFLIYSFMGSAISNLNSDKISSVAIINTTNDFYNIYSEYEDNELLNVISITEEEVASYQEKIDNGEWELLIHFDADFEDYVNIGDKPSVSMYSNPNETTSGYASSRFLGYLQAYQEQLSFELYGDSSYFVYIPIGTPIDRNQMIGKLMSTLLPMLVVMFIFSGAMSIGPESIAGEKERGTFATLLITPIKRSEIAIGKILSLSVLSLISAVSSFIGIIASLPKLLQLDDVNVGIYGISDYVMILFLLFSTVFVIVGIISVVSAYAKNLKEAGTLIMPIYILTILVSITSMFGDGAVSNFLLYLIPIYNTVQTMTAILTFDPNTIIYLFITIGANLCYLCLLVYLLNKMFKSEKIMFAK